jgi:hypothetical protein
MIRFLPLLAMAAIGCARPEPFHSNESPILKTADQRELELKQNLREDVSWSDQEQRMADAKAAFGDKSNGDSTGPSK